MPFGEPGAGWLLLNSDVQLRHTRYDLARAADRIRSTTYPEAEDFAGCNILYPPSEKETLAAFMRAELKQKGHDDWLEPLCAMRSRRNCCGTPETVRSDAAIERPNFLPSPHFGHGGFLNTIFPSMRKISSCQLLPQPWHANLRGTIETVGCITGLDDRSRQKVAAFSVIISEEPHSRWPVFR
jgi:hypothetical protein